MININYGMDGRDLFMFSIFNRLENGDTVLMEIGLFGFYFVLYISDE